LSNSLHLVQRGFCVASDVDDWQRRGLSFRFFSLIWLDV
jgi:hypothetical protein